MTDLDKVTLNLRPGDFAFLKERFGKRGGASRVVRVITARFVDHLRARPPITDEQLKELVDLETEMEIDI